MCKAHQLKTSHFDREVHVYFLLIFVYIHENWVTFHYTNRGASLIGLLHLLFCLLRSTFLPRKPSFQLPWLNLEYAQ